MITYRPCPSLYLFTFATQMTSRRMIHLIQKGLGKRFLLGFRDGGANIRCFVGSLRDKIE